MGGGTRDGELDDSEIKKLHGLEYLTTIERDTLTRKMVGFAARKFVVVEVLETRSIYEEMPLGNELYQLFKIQAQAGNYSALRHHLEFFEATRKKE